MQFFVDSHEIESVICIFYGIDAYILIDYKDKIAL